MFLGIYIYIYLFFLHMYIYGHEAFNVYSFRIPRDTLKRKWTQFWRLTSPNLWGQCWTQLFSHSSIVPLHLTTNMNSMISQVSIHQSWWLYVHMTTVVTKVIAKFS